MKKIFIMLAIGITVLSKAQLGVNFGIRGNTLVRASSSTWTAGDSKLNSKESMGFNGGIFSKFKIPLIPIFLMPEVYFTQYKSQTTYTSVNLLFGSNEVILNANSYRIDIPVLIGYELFGICGIFAGPVFYNQLRSLNKGVSKIQSVGNLSSITDAAKSISYEEEYVSDKTSMGYQFGISIDVIPKLTITARYEMASKEDKRKYIETIEKKNEIHYSNKPKFFVLGAGFKF